MADPAIDLAQPDVPSMREIDVVGLIRKTDPFYGHPFLMETPNLLLLWAIRDGFFMAFQTYFNLWETRKGLLFHVLVTCITLQPLFLMGFMIEPDRLLYPFPHDRAKDNEKQREEKDY